MVVGRVFGLLGCCEPDHDQVEEQRKGTGGGSGLLSGC